MMNNDGNMISGNWINKYTGETVNVRSSIIDGDQMIIVTNEGMIDMNDFSQNYIQVSDEVFDENGNILENASTEKNIETHTKTFNKNELDVLMGKNKQSENFIVKNDTTISVPNHSEISVQTMSENYKIIKKVFSKLSENPTLNINIDWEKLSKDKLQMLIDTFDIEPNEISKFIYDNYFLTDTIIERISDALLKYIKS